MQNKTTRILRNDHVERDISLIHEIDSDSHGVVTQGTTEGKSGVMYMLCCSNVDIVALIN
jgi:hypothetical protein